MATATRPRGAARKTKSDTNGHAAKEARQAHGQQKVAEDSKPAEPAPRGDSSESLITVSIDAIVVNPRNPRKHFDQAELDRLAASIKNTGLVQPPRVRPVNDGYELVAGERRWRAAKLAGLEEIPVISRAMTDSEAFEATLVENLERRDLNAIEEAQGLERALLSKNDGGLGLSQAQLAARFNRDPSWVSNRLRLLELPKAFQGWIVSQEMPATHGRVVLKWKDHADVLAAIAKKVPVWLKRDGTLGTVAQFEEATDELVGELGEELEGYEQDYETGNYVDWTIKPTDEQRAELRVVKVKDRWGEASEVALNTKLLEKLKKEKIAEAAKKQAAKGKPAKGADGKPAKPTAAQLKAKASERAKQLGKNLHAVRLDWLRYLSAKVLLKRPKGLSAAGQSAPARLHAWLALSPNEAYRSDRCEALRRVLKSHDAKVCTQGYGSIDIWKSLAGLDQKTLDTVLIETLAAMLWNVADNEPSDLLPDDVVEGLAADLGVDIGAAWDAEKLGPLTERYFSLRTKDELAVLGKELGVYLEDGKSKDVMISRLTSKQPCKLPRELSTSPKRKKG
jgi:ParB family chromosome partitioning protein